MSDRWQARTPRLMSPMTSAEVAPAIHADQYKEAPAFGSWECGQATEPVLEIHRDLGEPQTGRTSVSVRCPSDNRKRP